MRHRWIPRRWGRAPSAGLIEARELRAAAEHAERLADEHVRAPMAELRRTNHVAEDIARLIRTRGAPA